MKLGDEGVRCLYERLNGSGREFRSSGRDRVSPIGAWQEEAKGGAKANMVHASKPVGEKGCKYG